MTVLPDPSSMIGRLSPHLVCRVPVYPLPAHSSGSVGDLPSTSRYRCLGVRRRARPQSSLGWVLFAPRATNARFPPISLGQSEAVEEFRQAELPTIVVPPALHMTEVGPSASEATVHGYRDLCHIVGADR